MNKKTKNITIGVGVFIIISLISIAFILLYQKDSSRKYPEETIQQENIATQTQSITFNQTFEEDEKPLYKISSKTRLEQIKYMMSVIGFDYDSQESEEGVYYHWYKDEDYFIYELDQNYLIFKFSEGIEIGDAVLNKNSFKNFVKTYLDLDFNYEISSEETRSDGVNVAYANRILENGSLLAAKTNTFYTDYLGLENGKVLYGKLLLTEFIDSDIILPLISSATLSDYINLDGYPKEVFPDFSVLQTNVLSEVDYKSSDFEEVMTSLNSCVSSDVETIYLYSRFDDESLTPTYKLDTMCLVDYENKQYSIPVVIYVNAIDPQYVSSEE